MSTREGTGLEGAGWIQDQVLTLLCPLLPQFFLARERCQGSVPVLPMFLPLPRSILAHYTASSWDPKIARPESPPSSSAPFLPFLQAPKDAWGQLGPACSPPGLQVHRRAHTSLWHPHIYMAQHELRPLLGFLIWTHAQAQLGLRFTSPDLGRNSRPRAGIQGS